MLNAIAKPFGVLLMFFYDLVSNYGVAIMLIALVIKVILLPFQMKSKRGMIQQARLQPKIAELQKKHGTNKAKLNEETMKLYKEEGVNPASGCIWGFLPLPIMLAFFQVIRQPLTVMMGVAADLMAEGGAIYNLLERLNFSTTVGNAYIEIAKAQFISKNFELFTELSENLRKIDFSFLRIDLGMVPQWDFLWNGNIETYGSWVAGFALFIIPLLSGGTQFLASALNRKMTPQVSAEGQAKSMNTMMMLMPLFSVYIAFITPAALGFYWTVSTVLQVLQDVWLTKVYTKKIEAEEAVKNEERRIKEAEIEAKRIESERRKAEGVAPRTQNTSKRKKQKSGKQEQLEKAAEWQKKKTPEDGGHAYEPSRVGNRRYARGRAYDPDRYGEAGEAVAALMLSSAVEAGDEDGEGAEDTRVHLEFIGDSGESPELEALDSERDGAPVEGGEDDSGDESGELNDEDDDDEYDEDDEYEDDDEYDEDDDEYEDDEYEDDDDEDDDEYEDDDGEDDDEYDDDEEYDETETDDDFSADVSNDNEDTAG